MEVLPPSLTREDMVEPKWVLPKKNLVSGGKAPKFSPLGSDPYTWIIGFRTEHDHRLGFYVRPRRETESNQTKSYAEAFILN